MSILSTGRWFFFSCFLDNFFGPHGLPPSLEFYKKNLTTPKYVFISFDFLYYILSNYSKDFRINGETESWINIIVNFNAKENIGNKISA